MGWSSCCGYLTISSRRSQPASFLIVNVYLQRVGEGTRSFFDIILVSLHRDNSDHSLASSGLRNTCTTAAVLRHCLPIAEWQAMHRRLRKRVRDFVQHLHIRDSHYEFWEEVLEA